MKKNFIFSLLLLASLAFAQGSVLLVGGGSENYNDWSDAPYRWLVEHAPNRNILILDYVSPSSFLPNYFKSLGANTATNLVINSRAVANDSVTYRALLAADGFFLRGGDQWQYVSLWKGTLTEQALRQAFQRGAVIGGTSAGAMALSEVVFDARTTSVDPRQALRAPLNAGITLTDDFLRLVPNTLVDTHFHERGRLGRLLAMLAVYRNTNNRWVNGIGVDDRTALGISSDGSGEVFGSGVVALLRATEQTQVTVQSSKPLSFSHVAYSQMTKGFRFDLQTGQLLFVPPSAMRYTPELFIAFDNALILDGSDQSSDWLASASSVNKFLATLAPTDTVGIVSSPATPIAAQTLATHLSQRNVPQHLLWFDTNTKNSAALAQQIGACGGFVFVANQLDSLGVFLLQSLAGYALQSRMQNKIPLLFLGDDAKFAGKMTVGQTEFSTTAAYRGRLTLTPALQSLPAIIMPRAWQNSDYHENRMSGLFWGIAKRDAHYGILLDAGTHLSGTAMRTQVFGATPAIFVNAARAEWIDFSTYRASNSVGPRQSAALTNAVLHVVTPEQQFDFFKGEPVKVEEREAHAPKEF
ncbi:MAG: cyanophycinase, partial [candidate division KSB1 bacterium]